MNKVEQLKEKIQDADFVLIGIGEEFNETFEKIGEHPVLMKGLGEIDKNSELDWAVPFLEKQYLNEQKNNQAVQALKKLFELVKDKNYFVVTTCIDENVKKAGFEIEKIVEPCGNYQFLQCSEKCSETLYEADTYVTKIVEEAAKGDLSAQEQPKCPICGKPLVFNNILIENYLEKGYLSQWEKYTKWLQLTLNRKLCILELGVGMNLPNVIRWPFEKIAFYNQKASFFRINKSLYQMTQEIGEKGISIEGNAQEFLLTELD